MLIIQGTNTADTITGDPKQQYQIWGQEGNDVLTGGMLADELHGGKGDDSLAGGSGNDTLYGDSGNDALSGGGGDDRIDGGDGNDVIDGGKGNDAVSGGKGNDHIEGNSGNDFLVGNSGDDTLIGGSGNDTLDGSSGNDQLQGGSGDDLLIARSGTDLYDGGSGVDTVDFSNILGKVTVDLSKDAGTLMFGHTAAPAKLTGIEGLIGNGAGDTFTGSKAANTLVGGAGADWMRGGAGSDTLTGGAGADTFVYLKKDLAGGAVDTIKDFTAGTDKLDLADFLKGHAHYADAVKLVDSSSVFSHSVMVQGLVNHVWTTIAMLDGVTISDVGVDHHAMILSDLGLPA